MGSSRGFTVAVGLALLLTLLTPVAARADSELPSRPPKYVPECEDQPLRRGEERKIKEALGLVGGWGEGREVYDYVFGFDVCFAVEELGETESWQAMPGQDIAGSYYFQWQDAKELWELVDPKSIIFIDQDVTENAYPVEYLAHTLLHEMMHAKYQYEVWECGRPCVGRECEDDHKRMILIENRFYEYLGIPIEKVWQE